MLAIIVIIKNKVVKASSSEDAVVASISNPKNLNRNFKD